MQTMPDRRHITPRSASGFHARDRGALHGWGGNFQRLVDHRITAGMKSAPHGTASATRVDDSAGKIFDRRSNAGTGGIKDACGLSDSSAVR
jgi:hypothetical protein